MECVLNSPQQTTALETTRRARPLELGVVALGLVLVIVVQLSLTETWWLFGRYFWLDEIYTNTLVTDDNLGHAMHALQSGVETHPPALYLLLRGYRVFVHTGDEVALRSFALLAVVLALVGIYACLRECLPLWASVAAMLACWCHPLILSQAFNGRFYGAWLAAIVWCAYFLVRQRDSRRPVLTGVAVAACAVLVCTIHYFGILSLVLVAAAEWLARRRERISRVGILWAVAGPMALAACLPLLQGQRQALTETTWMAPITLKGAVGLARSFVDGFPIGWIAVAAWLSMLFTRRFRRSGDSTLSTLWGLTSLLALPLVVVALSCVWQPVYDTRYCFPAVAGLAGVAAFIAAYCSHGWAIALCGWLALIGGLNLQQEAQQTKALWVDVPQRLIAELREQPQELPIVFELPWQLYVVDRYAPDLRSRCVLLDYETGEIGNRLPGEVFARDLARRYSAFYPKPPTKSWKEIRHWPRFLLVPADYGLAAKPPPGPEFYPGFDARPLAPGVYELTAANNP